VVIEGEVDLVAFARDFRPLIERRGADVLRADRVFLEAQGRVALIEALAVEAGRKLPFYIRVSRHERGSATVRVDPLTHPERSPGVREIVARVAAVLLDRTPGARVTRASVELPISR
jgi:hypothetical protein